MDGDLLLLSLLKTAIVGLGIGLSAMAWRAHHRLGDPNLRLLAYGLIMLTLSAVAEGLAYNLLGWSLVRAQIAGAILMGVALLALVYSLLVRRPSVATAGPWVRSRE